jgi:hypothetical protein
LAAEAVIEGRQDPAGSPGEVRAQAWRIPATQLRRLLAAAMLGAAVFLVQAGVAEILLRGDRICQEARLVNWAYNPQGCQPEAIRYLLQGLSHGIVGALRPDLPPVFGVLTMAAMMAVLAGLLGLLPFRQSVPGFLLIEALAAVAFGMLGFIVVYVG